VKWTPPPWRADKRSGYVRGHDCVVAVVGAYNDPELARFNKKRWDADKHMIEASPALYAALADLLDSACKLADALCVSGDYSPVFTAACAAANTALEQARGERTEGGE